MTATAPVTAPAVAPATAPVAASATVPATGTAVTGPERTVADARARIDALDDRIIGLIQERMAVSTVVQDTRIASGGRRVHLSREMDILGRYREALGRPGTSLAMTLLELCRGRV